MDGSTNISIDYCQLLTASALKKHKEIAKVQLHAHYFFDFRLVCSN